MSRRLILTATIAISGALIVPVAALALHVDPSASSRPSTTTVDRHDDDRNDHAPTTSPPTTAPPPVAGGDEVSVRIPSIVMVRVDARGRVTAIATNSGRAPQRGDLVYVYGPDGSVQQTTTLDVTRRHWHGDFSRPAVFQPQSIESSDD
jgi:hypothetical protein